MASRVASSAVSVQFAGNSGTLAAPVNVTAGNALLVHTITYNGAGGATAPSLTKSSGTATIGTPRLDVSYAVVLGTKLLGCLWVIPITGSGSLVINYANSGNDQATFGWDEITGLDATPVLDVTWTNTGTGTTYSTGAQSVAGAGIIVAGFGDNASSPVYGPYSDASVWEQTNSANVTGAQEEKITSGAGSNTLTMTVNASSPWQAVAAAYKDAAGGAAPTLGLAPSRFAPGKRGPGRGPVLNAMRNLAYSPASTSVAIAGTTRSGARLLGAALTQTQPVAGTARGTARLNGALSQTQPIAGTARSSSRLTGTLAQTQAVAGIVRALGRLSGTLGQSQAITGTTHSGARLTGAALTQSQPITGTARSGARLTGASLLQSLPLAGTVRSLARLIGNLNVTAPGAVAIAGTTRAISRLLGLTVTQTIPLTGQARSLSRTQGVLTQTVPIAGTARSTSRLTGLLTQSVAIAGVVRSGARNTGAAVLQSVALRGVVRGMARLFGALDAFVAGTVRAKSPTSATVTVAATSASITSSATAVAVTSSATSATIT